MKLFECQSCGQLLYFENTVCVRCGHSLGYLPGQAQLSALQPAADGRWQALGDLDHEYRACANAELGACNWMVPAESQDAFCRACRLNRTVPNLNDPARVAHWRTLETAKRRLIYSLMRLGLSVRSKDDDPQGGLAFDFLSAQESDQPVMTGHADGVITIDLAEADPVARERMRTDMTERYRTVLGHFRHEIGHYFWNDLVARTAWLEPCRALFGDERADYGDALKRHYEAGPPVDWAQRFISSYATAHPWEDFAESWAHYLHIVDTLETAQAFGMTLRARAGTDPVLSMEIEFDPYRTANFDTLVQAWVPLTAAVNSLNDSMGQPDLYPFVLAHGVIEKLRFIHRLVRGE
ncbi:putative zinc-binding peptidase [Thalassobaculum sp.]|uniref:zinc-binding metallopeptidase family protein n=1 Tax=Thalassobaculum sp. TaxID=2022740 RepID=UPI0032EFA293